MKMSKIVFIFLAGAIGGALRGVLGIAKSLVAKKNVTINWIWFFVSILIASILGMITASFFLNDARLALIGGYAGSDFLEGLMKIILKDKFQPKKGEDNPPKADSPKANPPKANTIRRAGKSGFGELLEKAK